ncbi:hypothetical protein NDU88_003852 [Pleurodeles waltl]|uniref:Uncharacterized protein n=1 Tax=Pleurodeles waltl TaxID=8319 RepID=A0AAV7RGC7_PLEWA|nr:hypothetical protein NDU88_003852 [Pleurodeles waltl]
MKPRPRVKLLAAAREKRTARVRRGTSFGSPCRAEGAGAARGTWWVSDPLGDKTTKPVRRTLPWIVLGPAHGCSAWPRRGTKKAE